MIELNDGRDAQWRAELRAAIKPKERGAVERVTMAMLDPQERIRCNDEVNRGLTDEQAHSEATRCLDCANPQCVTGCPVAIDIPGFIKRVEAGDIAAAAATIKRTSALPAVCGRVCPQEKQCESKCIHNRMGNKPVAIGYLERYVADWQRKHPETEVAPAVVPNGRKVAVVGSGPAGLTYAGQKAQQGFKVTVFEALHEVGGVLKYGIPEFRLPNAIVDHEIDGLRRMGVEFVTNCVVGKTITVDELKAEGYEQIFIGSGAGFPRFMNIPGENLKGVMSSNEYLTRINLMEAGRGGDTPVLTGHTVAVIGGGNTAMDSSRTALRQGAERVLLVYRRGRDEMPARREEIEHAIEEGVELMTLHNPVEYLGDESGRVKAMRVQRMELGEPDASGRRSPVPVEGAIDEVPVDLVIVAVGVSPNPLVPQSVPGLEMSRRGTIVVDENTMQSNIDGLVAGGDIVRGGATVILAMGDGRRAATAK